VFTTPPYSNNVGKAGAYQKSTTPN